MTTQLEARQETGDGELLLGLNLRMPELGAAIAAAQLGKMSTIVERARTARRELISLIPERDGVRPRTAHDADGDCGSVAGYVFDTVEDAAAVAERLNVRTLVDSPKHYYGGLPALRAVAAGERSRSVPFRAPGAWPEPDVFRPGHLPHTDDVLARSVAISVGLSDSYLGAGFGITAQSDRVRIEAVAERFRTAVNEVLGQPSERLLTALPVASGAGGSGSRPLQQDQCSTKHQSPSTLHFLKGTFPPRVFVRSSCVFEMGFSAWSTTAWLGPPSSGRR